MNIILILSLAFGSQESYDYDKLLKPIYECKTVKRENINPQIIQDLIEIENSFFMEHDIPHELRGMLLAAACNESGYNPFAKGDWYVTKKGIKRARAIGILQFWPWAERKYKLDRTDYKAAAIFWMAHIVATRKKNYCSRKYSNIQKWISAWTQAIRGRLTKENNFRCGEKNKHYKRLRRWKKKIK